MFFLVLNIKFCNFTLVLILNSLNGALKINDFLISINLWCIKKINDFLISINLCIYFGVRNCHSLEWLKS